MRRQILATLGGWLAVTAVGFAQTHTPRRPMEPIRPVMVNPIPAQQVDWAEEAEPPDVLPPNPGFPIRQAPPAANHGGRVHPIPGQLPNQYQPPAAGHPGMPAPPVNYGTPVYAAPPAPVYVPPGVDSVPVIMGNGQAVGPNGQPLAGGPAANQKPGTPGKPVPVGSNRCPTCVTPCKAGCATCGQSQCRCGPMWGRRSGCGSTCGSQCVPACGATAGGLCGGASSTTCANPCGNPCGGGCGSSCGTACCDPCQSNCCEPCGPGGKFWVSGEYLLWGSQGMLVPVLVTSSPNGTPRTAAGVLGDPRTSVVFGGNRVNNDVRSGFRLRGGAWLDDCQTIGIEGSYFFLSQGDDSFSAFNPGSPASARPFFNANTNQQDSQLISFPNTLAGAIAIDTETCLYGFDANLRKNLCCACDHRTDLVIGYRYLNLRDDVNISEDLTVTGTDPVRPVAVGTRFQVFDSFSSRNEFNGGQIGLAGEYRRDSWYVGWRGLIAFGATQKDVTISGGTTITPPGGAPVSAPGGLLALPTNIGNYSATDFAVVPELGLNLGYSVSENLRVFVGYTFLYWSNVSRAGDQIDVVVNPTQIAPGLLFGAPRPAFTFNDTDFWTQGVSFGVELRY